MFMTVFTQKIFVNICFKVKINYTLNIFTAKGQTFTASDQVHYFSAVYRVVGMSFRMVQCFVCWFI
jgi:hypothetical protein